MLKINDFRGDLIDIAAKTEALLVLQGRVDRLHTRVSGGHGLVCSAVLLFSKLNITFFGHFDPESIFLHNEHK